MERQQIKQVRFRALTEIEDLEDEVRECNERLYPVGDEVCVERGNGIWVVEVLGFDEIKDPQGFRGKNINTGKIHWFKADQIID